MRRLRATGVRARWITTGGLLALVGSCGGSSDYVRPLPNGYRFVRANVHEAAIADSAGWLVVGPTVTQLGHTSDIVFGTIVRYEDADSVKGRTGHFLLDTRTREVRTGLSESDWLAVLAARGVRHRPKLESP
jgi:hypothetical protein